MKKTLLAALLSGSVAAWALPENGQVIQGQLQMTQPNANVLQILQSSPTGIINWGSFSIGPQQLVQFLQPNSAAATLNRVIGQEPSQILGQLQANGRILLINPNGILFGPGSIVDTGSFLASTLAIQDQDFLEGRYDLRWDGVSPMRAVVNQGEIRVAEGGFLALVSPLLDNQGMLVAERGQVVLGATRQASLTVDARGLLQVVIPDGFRGTPAEPGAVLLTQGQMSDTLAQVVTHYAGAEAGGIVDTGHGIQLVGGEGLLVNQGTIRADAAQGNAGSILLDSSQATVLTPGSVTSAMATAGNGGDIRVFSADYTRQQGLLQANSLAGGDGGFVEVSAPHVAVARGADVSALQGTAGVFLIDPDNVFIRVGGADPANQPFGVPGSGDIEVDPSALNVTGAVFLEANQSIFFDAGVQVNLDGDTDLRLQAMQDIVMNPGSAVHATDPSASIVMIAGGAVEVTTLDIATSHIRGDGFVRFNGGTLGAVGSPSLVNVSSPSVSFADGTVTSFRASETNFNSVSSGDFLLGNGTRLELLGSTSNNVTVSAGGVGLNPGSTVFAPNTSTLHFNSTNGVFNMGDHSTILAGAGSALNVTATGSVDLRQVQVPDVRVEAGTFARFDGGAVGVAGGPTVVNVVAQNSVNFAANNVTDFVGSTIFANLTSPADVVFETNTTLNSQAAADLHFNAGGNFFADDRSRIVAVDPGARVVINATGSATVRSVEVPTSHINAGSFVQFREGTLGQPGSDTLVNVSAGGGVFLFAGQTLNVVGQNVEVDWLATGQGVALGDGSLLQLSGATSNLLNARGDNDLLYIGENTRINSAGPAELNFASAGNTILQRNGGSININGVGDVSMVSGVNVVLQGTSGMNATGAGSRLDVSSGNHSQLDGNLALPTVNVTAGQDLQLGGSQGRAGSATRIDGTASRNVILFTDTVEGSQVDWNLSSTGALIQASGSTVQVGGSGNHLNWSSGNNTEFGANSTLMASGPTQLLLNTGQRFIQFGNSTVTLADPSSNFDLTSGGSPALSRVEVGGRFSATASAGNNIRIANQVIANEVILTSPGQLLDDRTDNMPVIVAGNSLNVTVANISGPLTDPSIGLVNGLPFATGSGARVRFNLTGPNNTTLGERSANLFYAYPQSGDVVIVSPQSEVALYNEPAPPVPPAFPVAVPGGLSAEQFQEVTYQSAQAQVQLSNLYSVADLPASDNVFLLEYDNAGLTEPYSIRYMTSALVERVVLSPEAAVRSRRERDKRESERPTALLVTGDDEDEQTLYWRRLIEGIILWEE